MAQTNKVTLSYQGLADQGKVLHGYSEEVTNLITKVMNTMKNLNSVWDDAAAQDFTGKVENLKPTFLKFSESLEELSKHMINVSTQYKNLSDQVKNAQKF